MTSTRRRVGDFEICHMFLDSIFFVLADEVGGRGPRNWSFFMDFINVDPQCNKSDVICINSCITWLMLLSFKYKKLKGFNFSLILQITKLALTLRIGKSTFNMLIIWSSLILLPMWQICRAERIRGVSRNF